MAKNYIDLLIAKVALYADKPAIIFRGKAITYLELHQHSNDIAQYIISQNVNTEEIIPLILERSPDTIIAMIAVLKAGCAFLPISPITPCARITFILEDTKARMLISNLDNDLENVAIGVRGELYIGGAGLARGYLNNLQLTHQKFINHPKTNVRLYKTGDLVIPYDMETICYMERIDDQLKFGGIRIEAGEIESVIDEEPFVKKAIVKVHETEGYYKSLAAYIEIDEEKIFSNMSQAASTDFLKNIYDETYLHAENYEHGTINNCGWQSSFSGQLFSVEELSESWRFIKKIINGSDLTNVLEVGCGTGSLLLEYLDKAHECTVVEISSKAIDYVKKRLNSRQRQKVTFRHESVLNVHNHQKFSCIIINSVIQYLPSIHALITTLTQLVSATKANGTIIIGDVRSIELLDVYLLEKIRVNSTDDDLHTNLSAFYYKSRDAEIVLSPKFFYALKNSLKDLSHYGKIVGVKSKARVLSIKQLLLLQSPRMGELITKKKHVN